jgi:hypothetical protein
VTGVAASISVFLSDHDRGRLEFLLRSGKTEQRLVKRIPMKIPLTIGRQGGDSVFGEARALGLAVSF